MFRWLFQSPSRPARRARTFTPQVEGLESRVVPALAVDSPFNITEPTTLQDSQPATAILNSPTLSVVAFTRRAASTNTDIYFDTGTNTAASMIGTDPLAVEGASTDLPEFEPDVAIAALPNASPAQVNVVIVWTVDQGNGDLDVMYGLFELEADGTLTQLSTGAVAASPTAVEQKPQVVMDAEGNFIIVYQTAALGSNNNDLAGVIYNAQGMNPRPFTTGQNVARDETAPRIDINQNGHFTIAFQSMKPSGADRRIELRTQHFKLIDAATDNPREVLLQVNRLYRLTGAAQIDAFDVTQLGNNTSSVVSSTSNGNKRKLRVTRVNSAGTSEFVIATQKDNSILRLDDRVTTLAVAANPDPMSNNMVIVCNISETELRILETTPNGALLSRVIFLDPILPVNSRAAVDVNASGNYFLAFVQADPPPALDPPDDDIIGAFGFRE